MSRVRKPYPPLPPKRSGVRAERPAFRPKSDRQLAWDDDGGIPRVLHPNWWLSGAGNPWPRTYDERYAPPYSKRYFTQYDEPSDLPRWLAAIIIGAFIWWGVAVVATGIDRLDGGEPPFGPEWAQSGGPPPRW